MPNEYFRRTILAGGVTLAGITLISGAETGTARKLHAAEKEGTKSESERDRVAMQ